MKACFLSKRVNSFAEFNLSLIDRRSIAYIDTILFVKLVIVFITCSY